MNRSVKFSAPLLSLMLLLGGCGGGGDGKQASPTKATTAATTPAVPDQKVGGVVGDPLLAQRCVNYASFVGSIGLSMAAAMDPNAAKQLEELKSKTNFGEAPEEIKGDFAVITAYAEDLGKVLAKYIPKDGQYDPQAIAAIGEFSQRIDTVKLQKASENINSWLKAHCPG
jgi:hypothetical protein